MVGFTSCLDHPPDQPHTLNAPASLLTRMTIWLPGSSSLLLGIFGLGIGIVSNQLIQTNQAVIFFGMP